MVKIHEKVMKADFVKSLKKLIIFMVCVGVLGGGLSVAMSVPWIGENISNIREWKQERAGRYESREWNGDSYDHDWQEEWHYETDDFFENMPITTPPIVAVIVVGITGLLGGLCLLGFWILVAVWLYQAAVRSGMNGLLWLAAGMFGNVFAAGVFLLVRSFERIKCPSCGSFQSAKVQYCSTCGTAMYEKCTACGEVCAYGDQFCHTCGKSIHGKEA